MFENCIFNSKVNIDNIKVGMDNALILKDCRFSPNADFHLSNISGLNSLFENIIFESKVFFENVSFASVNWKNIFFLSVFLMLEKAKAHVTLFPSSKLTKTVT